MNKITRKCSLFKKLLYICRMKVLLIPNDKEDPILFKSKTEAAFYARMHRLKFTREMKKHGKVQTIHGTFVLPKTY